jgi:hypothetical protein
MTDVPRLATTPALDLSILQALLTGADEGDR